MWIEHCVRKLFKAYTMLKSAVCDIFYFAKYQRTSVLSLENITELKNVVVASMEATLYSASTVQQSTVYRSLDPRLLRSSCAYIHYVHVVYSMWIKHCEDAEVYTMSSL